MQLIHQRPRVDSVVLPFLAAAALMSNACAGVVTFFEDFDGWSALAGTSTKLDFSLPSGPWGVVPGTYYASLGVTLGSGNSPDPADWIFYQDPTATDGWVGSILGYDPTSSPAAISFDHPIDAIALDRYAGSATQLHFYLGGQFLGTYWIAVPPPTPPTGGNYFFGWVTDFQFDKIAVGSGSPPDNIYFPTIVPAPAAMAIALGMLVRSRRARG